MSCFWYWWAECTINKSDATTHCILKLGYPFFPYDTDFPYDSLSILPVQVKANSDTVWNSSISYLGPFYDTSYFSKSPIYDFGDSSVVVHGYYSAGAWVDKDTTLSPINLILKPDSANIFSLKMRDGVGNSDSLRVDLGAFLAPLILISGDSISFQITRLFSASYTTLQPDCSFSQSEVQKNAFQDSSVVLNIDIDFNAVKHCSDSSRVKVATIVADTDDFTAYQFIELSAIQIYME